MLIGLVGLAGSGKSEVARVLMREAGFDRVKFADPLKNMLRTMLRDIGHTAEDVERYIEGDLKEKEVDGVGVTARRLMVTLGTEWGRECIAKDLWIRLWSARAAMFRNVVADDVRFPNEVDAIRERGGEIWQVVRPNVGRGDGAHVSEMLEVEADRVIHNDGSLGLLRQRVRTAWLFIPPTHKPGTLVGFTGVPDPYEAAG